MAFAGTWVAGINYYFLLIDITGNSYDMSNVIKRMNLRFIKSAFFDMNAP